MKIIYITNARIPTEKAHGYQISKMCEEFSQAGTEVELWIPSRKNLIKENLFEFYNIKTEFVVRKFKAIDFIQWKKIFGRYSFLLQSFFFLIRLIFVKVPKNSIIYSRQPEIIWLFKLRGKITVFESHIWFNNNFPVFLLKKCDYIITTNNFIKNEFIKSKYDQNKITVIPNGIDLDVFDLNITKNEAIQKIHLSKEVKQKLSSSKVLVYTGSFKTTGINKGIDEIFQALKILNDWSLFFLAVGGSIGEISYYKKVAENFSIKEQILLLPRVNQSALAIIQKVADILLMPFPKKAHYEYFMTPLKMFEYMASKRPIIASDLPSIREILNEENCFFCQPGNTDNLAAVIKNVLNTPLLAEQKSYQAYQDVLPHTWQRRAQRIIKIITNLK